MQFRRLHIDSVPTTATLLVVRVFYVMSVEAGSDLLMLIVLTYVDDRLDSGLACYCTVHIVSDIVSV